jgi:hypothetical protein
MGPNFRPMAQAVSRQSVTANARVRSRSDHVRFVVDKVALGQPLLWVLQFSPVTIIPPRFYILISYPRNENGPLVAAVQKHSFTPQTLTTQTMRSITRSISYKHFSLFDENLIHASRHYITEHPVLWWHIWSPMHTKLILKFTINLCYYAGTQI